MSRSDLTVSVDSPSESPAPNSIDWTKHALSANLASVGVYSKYEEELKRDLSDRDKMEKALAKVQLLDRKISIKEAERDAMNEEFDLVNTQLQNEIHSANQAYALEHGVPPPGERKAPLPSPPRGSTPPMSARSSSSDRFFVTDKMRRATPRPLPSPASSDQMRAGRRGPAPGGPVGSPPTSPVGGAPAARVHGTPADRNVLMAARAGQSSMTREEEARVGLLLAPDPEGDLALVDFEGDAAGDPGLLDDVFGGGGARRRVEENDRRLEEMGSAGIGEEDKPETGGRGAGVLRARARERAEREKARELDQALKALRSAPLPTVGGEAAGGGGLEAELSRPVGAEDIRGAVEDARCELEEGGEGVADKADLKVLLDSMAPELRRQAEVREQSERRRRADIVGVIEGYAGEEEEVKRWGDEIGEVYQSGFEGNGVIDDGDDEDEPEDHSESKSAESKSEYKDDEKDVENKDPSQPPAKDVFSFGMDLEAAREKAEASLRRADEAGRHMREAEARN